MSGIVLSASVRQNLLSLQSTADLLSTTQNRLATGNKVNSALDNPTNFFTALGLNNRASDINNLLDGIGNGVQVLQAANPVITFKTSTGTLAVTIGPTFTTGSGTATVSSLDQLNSVLASNGVQVNASVSATADTLTFTSTNDAASQTITTTG